MHFTHKAFWFFIGVIALVLGLIGVFLPLLPTTPFLIFASACFMRASPRIHAWLIKHPYLGPPIVEWQACKTIKASIKKKAFVMIVLSFLLSIIIAPVLWVKFLLLVLAITLLYWFSTIPSS
ncbi:MULTISPECIES: YbaN family protein [Aliivibrio]|uniref:Inner membrane protein n=1 Tax=Aliivibrio finisterrensis TaxID=511998 RepID=A0A4Q5KU78_9GAMM|nr:MULTISPECIES: YbaN family protein [Aliivibrio]MDD9179071.1 YbaN family protein [Aliivibrio sp. A6]RYU51535.1 DUF454 domain-containing protein [Aliivibrio finisterrensis]RYU52760.1 DUF454 domain-containing protein [Aliivibrio finisterrensis]RYU58258.1 DUF454 domain-containing protein [Aliivibrio finisterrensis]RYU64074.1 DUF454 domain-containing protein [Aliivibrio finisterrensis]